MPCSWTSIKHLIRWTTIKFDKLILKLGVNDLRCLIHALLEENTYNTFFHKFVIVVNISKLVNIKQC